MPVIVTGGTGFVASNVVKVLAEQGREVISIDIAPPDELLLAYTESVRGMITWAQADILNMSSIEEAASGKLIEGIIHAAVYTVVLEDLEKSDSKRIFDINLTGTVNMLELARKVGVKRFVYVSSGGVYGETPPEIPLMEDMQLDPTSLYSVTKYASELLTRRYAQLHGFEGASGRLSGPYGPMERQTGHRAVMSMMYDWTGKAIRGEPIKIEPRRSSGDMTYALDLAAGLIALLDAPKLNHSFYNVSRGIMVTQNEIVEAFRSAVPGIEFLQPTSEDGVGIGSGRGPADNTRLREDTGFNAEYDPAGGIRAYIEWRRRYDFTS